MISTNLFHLHFYGFTSCSVNLSFSSMLDINTILKKMGTGEKDSSFYDQGGESRQQLSNLSMLFTRVLFRL